MKRTSQIFLVLFIFIFSQSIGFAQNRTEIRLPDIPGYKTLKCDFHLHTVFSDGLVWPTIRVEEAWRDGLDAIALTDHAEYHPHKDVDSNINKPYELAIGRAKALNIILIKGTEITKNTPPGHLNALFIKDGNELKKAEWRDAVIAAKAQAAFIQWNHPNYLQPDRNFILYPEIVEMHEKGWIDGIEIVNGKRAYYPEAFKWAKDNKLTITGNTDSHNPVYMDYDGKEFKHRPMTLVFAKERSQESIKEALFAARTVVYFQNFLYGEEKYLKPLFEQSVEIKESNIKFPSNKKTKLQITNNSEVDFELIANGDIEELTFPKNITLPAGKTILMPLSLKSESNSIQKEVSLPYKVKNMLTAPDELLITSLKFNISYQTISK